MLEAVISITQCTVSRWASFLKKKLSESERVRESSHSLAQTSDAPNIWDLARPKSGAENSNQVSHKGDKNSFKSIQKYWWKYSTKTYKPEGVTYYHSGLLYVTLVHNCMWGTFLRLALPLVVYTSSSTNTHVTVLCCDGIAWRQKLFSLIEIL